MSVNLAWIPGENEILKVKKGDVIETVSKEKITFIEMRRTKWVGKMNGRQVLVPIYRDSFNSKPYAVKINGFDATVVTPSVPPTALKKGDLFALEGKKETYMYKSGNTEHIKAICVASGKNWDINTQGFTIIPIDLNKIKASI